MPELVKTVKPSMLVACLAHRLKASDDADGVALGHRALASVEQLEQAVQSLNLAWDRMRVSEAFTSLDSLLGRLDRLTAENQELRAQIRNQKDLDAFGVLGRG